MCTGGTRGITRRGLASLPRTGRIRITNEPEVRITGNRGQPLTARQIGERVRRTVVNRT